MPSLQPISPHLLPSTRSSENELLCKFANICKSIFVPLSLKVGFFSTLRFVPLGAATNRVGWRRHSLTFCLVLPPSSRCQHGLKLRRSAKSKSALFHVNKRRKSWQKCKRLKLGKYKNHVFIAGAGYSSPDLSDYNSAAGNCTALHLCMCAKPSSTLFSLNKRGEELARV